MPLRLIICPTIHIIVEDAEELTTEVQERITSWLTLPKYEPNLNGDPIRCEQMHGGSEFTAVPENEMESIESIPVNYADDVNPIVRLETVEERLERLRGALQDECISYGELAELQSLAGHIQAGDVELLEPAGVPEEHAYLSPAERAALPSADSTTNTKGA